MSGEGWVVIGALVLVAVVAVVMRRRLMRFTLEVFGLKVGAEGARGGVRVSRARAGPNIVAEDVGGGGTTVERSSAGGDIRASHTEKKPDDD